MPSVIILGATGRFGRAAAIAFADAGWRVTQTARHWPRATPDKITVTPTDPDALIRAVTGHDVIVNALNPPYPDWADQVPRITDAVIAAARATGATVLIPGNVYNYGSAMPALLNEDTPWHANTQKGAIRIRMERAYRDSGVRTIVLRAGDFLDTAQGGNWFDSHIAVKAWQGTLMYPGPRDAVHAWAWLPDMARAAVGLAERRADFAAFEEFGFAGYTLTGDALVELVQQVVGRPMRIRRMPWPLVRAMGLFSPLMREVTEMRYLWRVPHRVDGSKLSRTLPDLIQTAPADAITHALAAWKPQHG
ncbi:MAG: NAD(P)H-binding protein [Pseudomonadota bacterium]